MTATPGPEHLRHVVRTDYAGAGLSDAGAPGAPWEIVRAWVESAERAASERSDVPEPSAMSVATVDEVGVPDVRTVLMRELSPEGPGFYTNLDSAKARQLAQCPNVAAGLTWPALYRAVRFRGVARPLDREAVTAYFRSRPWGSRVGAWASRQSQPVGSREEIEAAYAEYAQRHPDTGSPDDVPLPDGWGGYRVVCVSVEIWEGRASRLHDRWRFTRAEPGRLDGDGWGRVRLQP